MLSFLFISCSPSEDEIKQSNDHVLVEFASKLEEENQTKQPQKDED